jgi:hypothetical protein
MPHCAQEERSKCPSRKNEETMTIDPVISQLTKERDSMIRRIAKREKEIAHFSERLAHRLMPNQVAMLQAQRARQVTMQEADKEVLVGLERSLAAETVSRS